METKFKPRTLRAEIQSFLQKSPDDDHKYIAGCLPANDLRLQGGVNADGEAVISRWWSITFFEGTEEQQNARLEQLRLDLRYQTPWKEGDIPVHFEGGATCDDAYAKIHEQTHRSKPPGQLTRDRT